MANYSFTVKRYKCYFNGSEIQSGIADVVTPKVTNPKATISGAGVIDFDVPIIGMPKMGPATVTFHAPSADLYSNFSGGATTLRFASAIYTYSSGGVSNGTSPALPTVPTLPEIIVMTGWPDELDPGRRESGNKATATIQFLPSYLYIQLAGKEYLEIDPISGLCRLNGQDVNAGDGI